MIAGKGENMRITTTKEIAEWLGVSTKTVYRYAKLYPGQFEKYGRKIIFYPYRKEAKNIKY